MQSMRLLSTQRGQDSHMIISFRLSAIVSDLQFYISEDADARTRADMGRMTVYPDSAQQGRGDRVPPHPCHAHHACPWPWCPALCPCQTALAAAAAAGPCQGLHLCLALGQGPCPWSRPSPGPSRQRSAGACPRSPGHPARWPSAGLPLWRNPHTQSPASCMPG